MNEISMATSWASIFKSAGGVVLKDAGGAAVNAIGIKDAGGTAYTLNVPAAAADGVLLAKKLRSLNDDLGFTDLLVDLSGLIQSLAPDVDFTTDGDVAIPAGAPPAVKAMIRRYNAIKKSQKKVNSAFIARNQELVDAGEKLKTASKVSYEEAKVLTKNEMHYINKKYPQKIEDRLRKKEAINIHREITEDE